MCYKVTSAQFNAAVDAQKLSVENRFPTEEQVRVTSERLRLHHYSPMLGAWEAALQDLTYKELLKEIDSVAAASAESLGLPDESPIDTTYGRRLEIIRLMVDQYKLIQRLRVDDIDAWDTIYEMYFDD